MPVPQTPQQLEMMLRDSLPSISLDGVRQTVRTAIFLNNTLAGMDFTYVRLAPFEQQDRFFRAANVRLGQRGDPNGGRVYENYYPTGGNPPCAPPQYLDVLGCRERSVGTVVRACGAGQETGPATLWWRPGEAFSLRCSAAILHTLQLLFVTQRTGPRCHTRRGLCLTKKKCPIATG